MIRMNRAPEERERPRGLRTKRVEFSNTGKGTC